MQKLNTSRRLILFIALGIMNSACAPQAPVPVKTTSKGFAVNVDGSGAAAVGSSGSSGTPISGTGAAPLVFQVNGIGNHSRHICVPAATKLVLRVMPHANNQPLLPYDPTLYNSLNGQLLYDGSPAYYSQLRVRISIPGTSAAWDFLKTNEAYSVSGDYSSYLRAVTATSVPSTGSLTTPEYDVTKTIYGSNTSDGSCTYWESQLHGCALSSVLRSSETAVCAAGQQKLLITNIVSDYPCNTGDPVNWCHGGSIQLVPDYQQWSVSIQVMTENTGSW